MTQRAFRLAYDGAPFHGFQRQPDVPTVEDALFSALRELGIPEDEPAAYSAAGRTDAGVSAAAQTVTFECPGWCDPAALNSELPDSIRAWASADVTDFHATYDAREREYVYFLAAPDFDDTGAFEAATRLSGEHDFHNLTPDETGTVRDVSIDLERDGAFLVVAVRAGGFPRQLVRRLLSLLRAVASGAAPRASRRPPPTASSASRRSTAPRASRRPTPTRSCSRTWPTTSSSRSIRAARAQPESSSTIGDGSTRYGRGSPARSRTRFRPAPLASDSGTEPRSDLIRYGLFVEG